MTKSLGSKIGIGVWLPLTLMIAVCLVGAQINYLLFHTIAEMLSIVIAFTAMIVAAQSRSFIQNTFVVYIATVIGWCAGLDLIHTLIFKGMNLLQSNDANPATQLWIAARSLQAVAFLVSPWMLTRKVRLGAINAVVGSISVVLVLMIYLGQFPAMYVEGKGLTPLKIYAEYVIIFILILTLIAYWRMRDLMPKRLFIYLCLALLTAIGSEFAFTKYVSVYATANLVGHLLKICTYWFIYLGLVETTLKEPFTLLSRSSSSFDSVPDATIITSADGLILQANLAAGTLVGKPVLSIIDQSSHALFHDSEISITQCPVCQRMSTGEVGFTEIIRFSKADQIYEYNVAPFISEGTHLACVQVIRNITEREHAIKEISDLTYLYEMLSATNRSIVHSNSQEELLASIFEAMVKGNAFPFLFIAFKDQAQSQLRIVHAHGFSIDHLSDLNNSLANPTSPVCNAIRNLKFGIVEHLDLPEIKDHDDWINYLKDQGIISRAFMPLSSGSDLMGVVVLYTRDKSIFNTTQLKLLEQMTADMSFALNSMRSHQLRIAAETTAAISERRFTEIFESTPAPLMIVGQSDHRVIKINKAMEKWLGYPIEEIQNENEWLDRVCTTDEEKKFFTETFAHTVNNLNEHPQENTSPELKLKAKDGTYRIAQAAITAIEEEIVISWADFTEIRRKDQALIESEKHFRSMIEQSVAGIYVRRDGKFIYSNPRYEEITGWSKEDLNNQNVLNFTTSDQANIDMIHRAWDSLEKGQTSVTYTVPFKHKSGRIIELELHAKTIDWDGMPAQIVMADDITERKSQQNKINDYVAKLEASMKGTLSAVANMVEMRDPYTAGHERRVGLIARDIALEMGWSEERAKSLELIGLVHDIGKIAIPAEILVKPSRLSPLEMELVKGHVDAGYEILKNIPFPLPVADIIRQHHERIDGSGYPQGLKDKEILPEAKILAVADVIESMATHRPYRPALGLNVALEEIQTESGKKYDPEVARAVTHMIKDKSYKLPG